MKPIVVGVDDSAGARAALRWALDHATRVHAPVVAVTCVQIPQIVGRAATPSELDGLDDLRTASGEWLRKLVSAAQGSGVAIDVATHVAEGHPVAALVAESNDAQLVVVGARGAGLFHRLLLGSVSNGVMHHAPCSVVVVRRQDAALPAVPPRVLVGYDGSADAEAALRWAADWTVAHGGRLTVVSSWQGPSYQGVPIVFGQFDPRRECEEAVEKAVTSTNLPDDRIDTVVVQGPPARVLVERSRDAELLVVGRRGVGAWQEHLLGSVSNDCVTHACCPVAVIPPER